MTFVRYEQLRAMRLAALRLGLTPAQIEDLFYNTAAGLVQSAAKQKRATGPAPERNFSCQGPPGVLVQCPFTTEAKENRTPQDNDGENEK